MKISVFTSTHNRKEKLARLIKSILDQEHENWELIIVDDGSEDGTEELFNNFKDKRIHYEKVKENRGHPVAIFNSGIIDKISGDLIIFLGSDDFFLENAFSKVVNRFSKEDSSVWKIGFLWRHENEEDIDPIQFKEIKKATFLSNEIMADTYIQTDYIFAYRHQFWQEFKKYFLNPDSFFTSFYDVAMNNCYIEKVDPSYILVAGWAEDNVSKGKNADIYFNWAVSTRKHLFDNYSKNMGPNFYKYTRNSLIRNLQTAKGRKKEAFFYYRLILVDLIYLLRDFLIFSIFFFLPSSLLHKIKEKFFSLRKAR